MYSLRHSHPEVNDAIRQQLDQIAHGYRYIFNSDPLKVLTGLITDAAGGSLRHMVFVSCGSEAVSLRAGSHRADLILLPGKRCCLR